MFKNLIKKNTLKKNIESVYTKSSENSWQILQNRKILLTANPQNAYKGAFPNHMWLKIITLPQSDEVVFAMVSFDVYKYIVRTCKNKIIINDILKFNEKVEILLSTIVNLSNIDDS